MAIILGIGAFFWGGIVGCTVFLCGLAYYFLIHALNLNLSPAQHISAMLLFLSIPFSAYLAGVIADRYAHSANRAGTFRLLAIVLAFAMAFNNVLFFDFVDEALKIISAKSSLPEVLFVFLNCSSTVIYSAAAIAFVLIVSSMALELPSLWLSGALNYGSTLTYGLQALRSILILTITALTFNLICGFMQYHLWPSEFLK